MQIVAIDPWFCECYLEVFVTVGVLYDTHVVISTESAIELYIDVALAGDMLVMTTSGDVEAPFAGEISSVRVVGKEAISSSRCIPVC